MTPPPDPFSILFLKKRIGYLDTVQMTLQINLLSIAKIDTLYIFSSVYNLVPSF